jgi:DNA-binding Xre family transcriptional regulator
MLVYTKNSEVVRESMKNTSDMAIEFKLKAVRESLGLSQSELGRIINQSTENIQRMEQGLAKSVTFKVLNSLCKATNRQPGDFLFYTPDDEA